MTVVVQIGSILARLPCGAKRRVRALLCAEARPGAASMGAASMGAASMAGAACSRVRRRILSILRQRRGSRPPRAGSLAPARAAHQALDMFQKTVAGARKAPVTLRRQAEGCQ